MTRQEQHEAWVRRYTQSYHSGPGEKAAVMSALSEAAHLCDAIADDIAAKARSYRGKMTHVSAERHKTAKQCGDAIWALRSSLAS